MCSKIGISAIISFNVGYWKTHINFHMSVYCQYTAKHVFKEFAPIEHYIKSTGKGRDSKFCSRIVVYKHPLSPLNI